MNTWVITSYEGNHHDDEDESGMQYEFWLYPDGFYVIDSSYLEYSFETIADDPKGCIQENCIENIEAQIYIVCC